jgi:hypothetical protein
MGIPLPASSTLCGNPPLTGFGEVGKNLAGFGILRDGTHGDLEDKILPASAVPVLAFASASGGSPVLVAKLKIKQAVLSLRCLQKDTPPRAAVTAIRTAPWDVLLPTEAHATVSPLTGNHPYFHFVDEFHLSIQKEYSYTSFYMLKKRLPSHRFQWRGVQCILAVRK